MKIFGAPHTAVMQTSSGASVAVLSTDLPGTTCPRADRAGGCRRQQRRRPGLGLSLWGKAVPTGESSPRADPEVPKIERHLLALLVYCYHYGLFELCCPFQLFIALT